MTTALMNLPVRLVSLQSRNWARTSFMVISPSSYDWLPSQLVERQYSDCSPATAFTSPRHLLSRCPTVWFITWPCKVVTNVIVDVQITAKVTKSRKRDLEILKPVILGPVKVLWFEH